ncbi:acyltransferase family protein [Actinoplanes sp. CA-030573]|uniref:acyltransferase family protein n=1 Tax=Actinoplanes sp. CA-030573 TaxID=3239898 RepID=UPI003D8C68F3
MLSVSGEPDRPRLDSLTSLRFFAAVGVVAVHVEGTFPTVGAVGGAAELGYTGVSFFFALSGFVLTWSARPVDSRWDFYARRFARIWPAHAVVTLAAIVVAYVAGVRPVWAALPLVLLLVHVWAPPPSWHYAFNGPSWSLSAEAFFYALFPFLIGAAAWPAARLRRAAALVVAALVIGALAVVAVVPDTAWGFLLYLNPAYRIGEFMLGMGLAVAIRRGWRPHWPIAVPVAAVVVVYAAVAWLAPRDSEGQIPRVLADSALLPAFLALIAVAAGADLDRRRTLLRCRPLVWLGERSFALYLVHASVIKLLAAALGGGRPLSPGRWPALAAGVLAVSVAVASLLFAVVERPAERWLRRRLTRSGRKAPVR